MSVMNDNKAKAAAGLGYIHSLEDVRHIVLYPLNQTKKITFMAMPHVSCPRLLFPNRAIDSGWQEYSPETASVLPS